MGLLDDSTEKLRLVYEALNPFRKERNSKRSKDEDVEMLRMRNSESKGCRDAEVDANMAECQTTSIVFAKYCMKEG